MSFQAVTWAIGQTAGGPSAKAVLWAIANYANERWCAWPSQVRIAEESEQSPDTVQRRLGELEARGIIRRIPLRFAGRKTVDFIILAPSPFFASGTDELQDLLPRGCVVDPKYVAADCGSDENATPDANSPEELAESTSVAPASQPQIAVATNLSQPQTLPQPAAHVTALVRQQEPVMEPLEPERETRARARISVKAFIDRWPSAPLDDLDRITRAWEALPEAELQHALDGIDPFLARLKEVRGKSAHVPAGWTYLEQRRWTLLATSATADGRAAVASFKRWSREWWAVLFAKIERAAPVAVMVKYAVDQAAGDWSERAELMPAPDKIAALKSYPSDGSAMAGWRPWFARRGVAFPEWKNQFWVFLPGEAPPSEATGPPAATASEEALREFGEI
jgi:hypothetical protein